MIDSFENDAKILVFSILLLFESGSSDRPRTAFREFSFLPRQRSALSMTSGTSVDVLLVCGLRKLNVLAQSGVRMPDKVDNVPGFLLAALRRLANGLVPEALLGHLDHPVSPGSRNEGSLLAPEANGRLCTCALGCSH
jgi:hypothetical protein